jgi:hypothetical protein
MPYIALIPYKQMAVETRNIYIVKSKQVELVLELHIPLNDRIGDNRGRELLQIHLSKDAQYVGCEHCGLQSYSPFLVHDFDAEACTWKHQPYS